MHVIAGERLQCLPLFAVIGDLDFAFGGAANPVELDAVNGADCAKVHAYPLFTAARAHPGAREDVWACDADFTVVVKERDLC